ncbi:MAG: AI-2E family transporter [Candidatus Altimarinota bacterium]
MTDSKASNSLVILCLIAVTVVLYILKPLLIPFLIAVMLSYILGPLVEKLASYKIPRIVTLFVIFIVGIGVLATFLDVVVSNARTFSENIPEYRTQFMVLFDQYSTQYPWLNRSFEEVISFLFGLPIGSYTTAVVSSSLSFLSDALLVIFFITYLCLSLHTYPGKIERAFPGTKGKNIQRILSHINRDIRQYISIHTFVSLGVGISVGIICWSFGIPFAFLWGFLAFVLNYIPTIGSIVASIPPVVIAVVQLGIGSAVMVALLIILAQMVWENVIERKMAGESLGMSAIVMLLFLVFWTWLWGIVGAILAVPIASMVKIVCENVPSLKPISVLMDDR